MYEVKRVNIEKASHLVNDDNPAFSGVVTGYSSGKLWVDNIEQPILALVYSGIVEGYTVMGHTEDIDVIDRVYLYIENNILPNLDSIYDFNFSVESSFVKEVLLKKLKERNIKSELEFYLRTENKVTISDPSEDYNIFKVDKVFTELCNKGEIHNYDMLKNRLIEGNTKQISFVALKDKTIVGVVSGTSKFNDIISIDIEVDENHRKKGLATVLTQYIVNEILDKKLIPQWNCIESNIGSRITAEKVGFKVFKDDLYYWFQ